MGCELRGEGLFLMREAVSVVFSVFFREVQAPFLLGGRAGMGSWVAFVLGGGVSLFWGLSLSCAFLSLPRARGGVTRPAAMCSCFCGGQPVVFCWDLGQPGCGSGCCSLQIFHPSPQGPPRPPTPRHLQILSLSSSLTKTCFSLVLPPAGGWSPACSVRLSP